MKNLLSFAEGSGHKWPENIYTFEYIIALPDKWNKEDTKKFNKALELAIAAVFPDGVVGRWAPDDFDGNCDKPQMCYQLKLGEPQQTLAYQINKKEGQP